MKKYVLIMAVLTIYTACQTVPDYDDLSSEFIVATNKDGSADFGGYDTFYISDTITNIGGEDNDTIRYDDASIELVAAVKENMIARGYTYVQRHQNPDIGMAMGVVSIVNIDYYPGWWWGYPGWFPFYGDYYPYYPWSTVYVYETGSLILDAYDLKNAEDNQQFRALWTFTSFGALSSSDSANLSRAVNSVNQSFEQSPYIQAN